MLQVEPQAFSSSILVLPFYLHKRDVRTLDMPLCDFLVDNMCFRTFLETSDILCLLGF